MSIIFNNVSSEEEKKILKESSIFYSLHGDNELMELSPVSEGINPSSQKQYKLQKRLQLPFNTKEPLKGNLVILNTPSLDSSINLLNHPIIYPMNHYKSYFIDYKYSIKVMKKKFISNNKKNRIPIYTRIDNETEVEGVNEIKTANLKNLYYDIHKYNQIFLDREVLTKNIKLKISAIMTILKNVIDDPRFSGYQNKFMIIDANAWAKLSAELPVNKQFNNILFIFYYLMLKDPDAYKQLGNIDIYIVGSRKFFRINPSQYNEKEALVYKRALNMVTEKAMINNDLEEEIKLQDVKKALKTDISNFKEKYAFTGNAENEVDIDELDANVDKEEQKEIIKAIEKGEEEAKKKVDTEAPDASDAIQNELEDGKTYREIRAIREKKATGKSTASLKRDVALREEQAKLKLDGKVLEEIDKIPREEISIPTHDVSKKVNTTNKNITKVSYPNIEKTYIEKMYRNDIVRIIKSLNDKKIGIYILDIDVQDTSDELNLKETWTVRLEDENRVRHTLKFDMPKFLDNKYVYLGGNKKVITRQQIMKPVVKTSPDTVQLVSSEYNKKIFITRYETKSTYDVEKFIKVLSKVKDTKIKIRRGNSFKNNAKYDTIFEYDEISKQYQEIRYKVNKDLEVQFLFNQDEVQDLLKKYGYKVNDKEFTMCFGFSISENSKPNPLWIDTNTQTIADMSICKYMAEFLGDEFKGLFASTKDGKKAVYSQAIVMKKKVPTILLLSYVEGLSAIIRRANIKFQFTDKKVRDKIYTNQDIVKFADGYLIYENSPFKTTLLMNGLKEIPTDLYTFAEFDEKEVYYDIFGSLYGRKNLASAFEQYYEFFIGPITKEVLDDYNYPTNFSDLMLFANTLLADNKYISEMNYNNVRIRSSEIVVTFLYEALATAYLTYKNTAYNNNPIKMSIPQDYVLKQVMTNQIVENYSKLNPMVELEKFHTCTPKGPAGMNLSDAYTLEKRAYDSSMIGVIGMSTSPDGNCGVAKSVSLEPTITNARGYLDLHEDRLDELKDVNLFSPSELLSPLGASRDDTTRTAMAVKQSKHVIPVKNSAPVLISNGSEQVIQYHLSSDFVVTAEEDGVVKEINEKSKIIVLEYQPKGKPVYYKAIDIGKTIDKNGAGGFFLSNTLEHKLTVGKKFKKDDVLAYDSKFFSDTLFGNKFNIGSLQKIMCMSEFSTFEDSTFVTKKSAHDMATEVVMEKAVTLGKNATVDKIVKVGDKVLVGDELIVFENSFEEESLNKLLGNIGEELKEEIRSMGKTPIKSKYSGVIEDIQIYTGSDPDSLSPSLKKLVTDYWKDIKAKKKLLNKYDSSSEVYKCGLLLNQPDHPIETKDGKIKGEKVDDGVLIIFYIKYEDIVSIGDKITFFTALKGTVGDVIPEGYEPFALSEPDEEISLCVAPAAVNARMTPSILLTMSGYKVLVDLKKKLKEIYES